MTMSDRDYYEILGLTPRADGTMVDQAYWHLARKYQALAETNPRARAMLDELNEAYGVLGTPRLRGKYDAFRDGVLIEAGVIQPVSSDTVATRQKGRTKKRATKSGQDGDAPRTRRLALALPCVTVPRLRVSREHLSWYGGGALILAVVAVGVWLSLSPLLIVGPLCAVAALALTRALRRQLPEINLTLPQVSVPEFRTQRIDGPKAGEFTKRRAGAGATREDALDANELRASTAAMISRWRSSVGLREGQPSATADGPSSTLVDIVRTERELEAQDAPLTAVIDILRGSGHTADTK
jgi:DnaJ domain